MLGSSIITSFIVLVSLKYFYFLDAQTSTQSFLNLKGKAHCVRVDITHSHCSSQVSLGMQAGVSSQTHPSAETTSEKDEQLARAL